MRHLPPPWPAVVSALPMMALTSQEQRTAGTHCPPVGKTSIFLDDPNAAVRILRETRSKPMGQNLMILTPGVLRQLVRTTSQPQINQPGCLLLQGYTWSNGTRHGTSTTTNQQLQPELDSAPCTSALPAQTPFLGLIKLCGAGLKAT